MAAGGVAVWFQTRPTKELQKERPTVWAPERTTMSSTLRFLAANRSVRFFAVDEGGGRSTVSDLLDTRPSRRPAGTWYEMLPVRLMLSRAAKATMSAQETVRGQLRSTAALAASITSKPRRLGLFGGASRSVLPPAGFTVRRTEASQPCMDRKSFHAR